MKYSDRKLTRLGDKAGRALTREFLRRQKDLDKLDVKMEKLCHYIYDGRISLAQRVVLSDDRLYNVLPDDVVHELFR